MPVISVIRDELFELLGQKFTDDEFSLLCFEFGIELDDITSEREMALKETGDASNASSDVIYKIDIPANRYDLLSIEGLTSALNVFRGKTKPPVYQTILPENPVQFSVSPSVADIRPFAVGAILRNIKFTKSSYDGFIKLQEKLHQGIGRRRTLVSVGTHDLDKLTPPFLYQALPPKKIKFAPLNETTEYDGVQLMEHLEKNQHLKKFLPIIQPFDKYPVITDKNNVVLSLPPIINGNHSKITLDTRNVFIEITATDKTKAVVFLQTMIASFSPYCETPFTAEQILVDYQEKKGKPEKHPQMDTRKVRASIKYISGGLGLNISTDEICGLLSKMGLNSAPKKVNSDTLVVTVPVTRSDILHECDIMEDLAIAYGYNNLVRALPKTITIASQQPLNKLTDLLRLDLASSGYYETLSLSLCSRAENFEHLNRVDNNTAAAVENPKTVEFQTLRTTLLVGLLKAVNHNQKEQLPLKLFETGDIILKDPNADTGASNHRRVAAIYCNVSAGFENIHGLLDQIMVSLNVPYDATKAGTGYHIRKSSVPTYLEGRGVEVIVNSKVVGTFGIIHPNVLASYDIHFPCSALELDLEPFV